MPGRNQRAIQELPSVPVQLVQWSLNCEALGTGSTFHPIVIPGGRDLVVEDASFWCEDLDSESLNMTVTLVKVASGADPGTASVAISSPMTLGATNGAGQAKIVRRFSLLKVKNVPSENIVLGERVNVRGVVTPSEILGLKFSSPVGTTTLKLASTLWVSHVREG